ncbi:ferritin-like domain-containing protein [uncultured Aquimarina sp.]|uniref:ferritin-like domain-containing protein n=1 Tax=uncultured Aquimarina sp. TaxID=575652 RepID=UPI00260ACCD5|nr:ferritin-like domain-containing protein [uncultured Aquimarina sp.]
MRSNQTRHLRRFIRLANQEESTLFKTLRADGKPQDACGQVNIPSEFNAKDWLSYLLHIDAELEHGLMVQYLYAAYSMGGDHIAEEHRESVRQWQEIILGIAKEEMGHFVSVQNVLRVIGAALNFNRQDFPWDTDLYPFPFKLEQFTKTSLAKYIFAESPANWLTITQDDDKETKEIKKEIKKLIEDSVGKKELGDPISCIFKEVLAMLDPDSGYIPDDVFQADTYPFQAKFDEWGRGYKDGARGDSMKANPKGAPNVLVAPLLSRTDTINAVKEIAEQGESTEEVGNELSHFERFLSIYKQWRKLPEDFMPSRKVATNPTIGDSGADLSYSPSTGQVSNQEIDYITDPLAQEWASLFDIRYRMLLTFLTHSFLLDDGYNNTGAFSPRGAIIHATFGEMYNLRSLSHVLMKMPLGDNSDKTAGPPFTIPYTMDLPIGESSRWKKHQDLIEASAVLIEKLLLTADDTQRTYLYSLKEADQKLNAIADQIINVAV